MQAVELDIDREVCDRAREWHVHLPDEVRLTDVGVLITHDAGVIGRRRRHLESRDRRRCQCLESEILDERSGQPVLARGEHAGEIAVERVTDQIGDARPTHTLGQDDDGVIIAGHLGLGQAVVVERDGVGGGPALGSVPVE